MTSSSLTLDKRRRTYVRMIGEIQHALRQALGEENAKRNLTRTEMARLLGTNKSFITRKLSGSGNMTLETLADLAFALDRSVKITLPARTAASEANTLAALPQTQTSSRGVSGTAFLATTD